MKVQNRVMDVTTTLEGEKVGMTIDQGALAHIMSVLTDLYSDPTLAVIREYSTNAFDAHVEAGVTRPIEVTTPTALAPFFRVRDYGEGLDAEDIRNIYSRYGASTKRQSDEVVGMLGLGCKSALTYSDQFTLTGIKNGVCTQVSISRDEDGSGSMTIVSQYETTDPSGVEVIVPVQRYNDFEEKSEKFFSFWDKDTVLLNGVAPSRIDGMWIADDILMTKELDRDFVVMGNVAYPIPDRSYSRWNTVSFVNIGDVHFTPSREALQMTAKTKETLAAMKKRVEKERNAALQRIVDAAPNGWEAIVLAKESADIANHGHGHGFKPTYKGQPIPSEINADKGKVFVSVEGRKSYRSTGWNTGTKLYVSYTHNNLWLVGFDGESFSPYKRQKLEQWMTEKGITDTPNFILTDKFPAALRGWVDPTKIYKWAEVDAQKIVRAKTPRADGRPTGSYDGYVDGKWSRTILAEDINTTLPLFFINKTHENENGIEVVRHVHPTSTVITIASNRVDKFKRDFPMAKPVKDSAYAAAKAWQDNLTDDDKVAIAMSQNVDSKDMLKSLEADRVDDPDLKTGIEASKKQNQKLVNEFNGIFYRWLVPMKLTYHWENPLDKYMLLTSMQRYGRMSNEFKDQLYLYLNAAYAAGQES